MSSSSCSSCSDNSCSSKTQRPDESPAEFARRQRLQSNLCQIKHVFFVLSGKGGVGKSTVAANLTMAMGMNGFRVGLLDIDFHGPSIPTLMGLAQSRARTEKDRIHPITLTENVRIMSLGFLLEDDNQAVIWRGPMKAGVIQQLLADVEWGPLDALVVDCPPGTGDEPLSIVQTVGKADGAVIVTTPQQVACADVRRSITFCHQLDLPVLGIIENMAGFVCPHCEKITHIFKQGGGEHLAADMGVPFLGSIPLDPEMVQSGDTGLPYIQKHLKRPGGEAFMNAVHPLLGILERTKTVAVNSASSEKH